jgi:hypothetical protein
MTMQPLANESSGVTSKVQIWAGRILSGFAALFLAMDGVMKLLKPAFVVKATVELGYPESEIVGIGVVLLLCTLLYVFPRTQILGAILLTGYLGGAIASKIRIEAKWSDVIFALTFAGLVWAGLWLRDARVRKFLS